MVEPNNILERINEIKNFVATAKLELAVKRCIDLYRDFNYQNEDAAILISTSYYMILNEEKILAISSNDASTRKQQVAQGLLKLLRELNPEQC